MQCFEYFCGHRKKLPYKLSQVVSELITRGLLKVLELFGIQHKLVCRLCSFAILESVSDANVFVYHCLDLSWEFKDIHHSCGDVKGVHV
jgi:hypothetical protein